MSIFSLNIRHLRNQKNWSRIEMANVTGIKRHNIAAYEEDRSFPNAETLTILSKHLSVSIDELINIPLHELVDKPTINKETTMMSIIEEKINTLLKVRGMTQQDMLQRAGLTRQGYNQGINSGSMRLKTLENIAQSLGVSLQELMSVGSTVNDEELPVYQTTRMKIGQPQPANEHSEKCALCHAMERMVQTQEKAIAALEKAVEALSKQLGEEHNVKDTGS